MLNQDYKEMLSILSEEGVEFMIVGAYALAIHGFPRTTGDIDLFVCPSEENSQKLLRGLRRFGAPLGGLAAGDLAKPGIVYQIGVAPTRIDIITSIDGVEFEEAASRCLLADFDGVRAAVISKEHLIKNKLSTGRTKDKLDAETLMQPGNPEIE